MACGCGKTREQRTAERMARMSPEQRERYAARDERIAAARAEKAAIRAERRAKLKAA